MTDLATVRGFEDLWRPPALLRRPGDRPVLPLVGGGRGSAEAKARLARVVRRAPEVMVKITGRTRDGGHLQAHLAYISRNGALTLEGRDGERLVGMAEVSELARDWAADDVRKRADAPLSHSVMLSMPAGTDPLVVRDAVRQFARETFSERYDYVFALHTDVDHPHVHLAVRSLGEGGERLNPRKADLDAWRQTFARTLRDRGVEAEATPRRARGIVRKPERMPIRKLRERYEGELQNGGVKDPPRVIEAAGREAQALARRETALERPWEPKIVSRQGQVRAAYLEASRALAASSDPRDQALAKEVAAFVASMPGPATRRNLLVRALREVEAGREPEGRGPVKDRPTPGKER